MNFPDYTKEFFNWLYFKEEEVWQGVKDRNRIKTMPIVVLGTSGIGKTTLVENIMKVVDGWYYGRGIGLLLSKNLDIEYSMLSMN